jgi:hypothetical protein
MLSCLHWFLDSPRTPHDEYNRSFVPGTQERLAQIKSQVSLNLQSDAWDVWLWLHVNSLDEFIEPLSNWDGYKLLTMSLSEENELKEAFGGGYKVMQLFIFINICRMKCGAKRKFISIF